ncbi:MAG TPA: DUF4301 family protein, partial [Dongiaceae bacterium]|nr:DUF4301 family protein [Dongiaceae bacterium]
DDLATLATRGITPAEASRQLALLRDPPARLVIERPCAVGDGIERLDPGRRAELAARHDPAAAAGRWMRFVPASGAATRMFGALLASRAGGWATRAALEQAAAGGDADARSALETLLGIDRFAFRTALAAALAARGDTLDRCRESGDARAVFDTLLDDSGLGLASRPKGLLPFHHDGTRARTAFEEQLREAAALGGDARGISRTHFTVSQEHRGGFERTLGELRPWLETTLATRLETGFSVQEPATDTLALADDATPFRTGGRLLLRPAGHGALIDNLARTGGDLVAIKNIDNVQTESRRGPAIEWARVLTGRLLELEEQVHALLARLDDPADPAAPDDALAFAAAGSFAPEGSVSGAEPDARARARRLLHRPMRVCGMVPNTGEPGGGPFWVRSPGGLTRQIVESAELDPARPDQRDCFARGTHFNPVFLVCGLRDHRGRPYPLADFVDPSAIILTRKNSGGRGLLALERPGLWNGAMARWLTVFVEIPVEVFTPVKGLNDLLRPEHQG